MHCYDPGPAAFSELPTGRFHGVFCTDVVEHCPEEKLPWVGYSGFARRFVFASIACFPAAKRLPIARRGGD